MLIQAENSWRIKYTEEIEHEFILNMKFQQKRKKIFYSEKNMKMKKEITCSKAAAFSTGIEASTSGLATKLGFVKIVIL